jgi:uncharacterized protein (DUF3084 family)
MAELFQPPRVQKSEERKAKSEERKAKSEKRKAKSEERRAKSEKRKAKSALAIRPLQTEKGRDLRRALQSFSFFLTLIFRISD